MVLRNHEGSNNATEQKRTKLRVALYPTKDFRISCRCRHPGKDKVKKRINDVIYRIQRNPKSKLKMVHLNHLSEYHGDSKE